MESFLIAAVIASTSLLFATLGEIITEKAGMLNLGVEGMMLLGATAGFIGGYESGNPYVAILLAIVFGGLGGLIYGFLTISLRSNQVVSGLALTIFGTGASSFFGSSYTGLKMSDEIINFFAPKAIPVLSKIPLLGNVFFNQSVFVYLAYLSAILMGIYMYHTSFGLSLKSVGEAPYAADAAGIHVIWYKYINVIIGGALCGLGGAFLSVVNVPQWQDGIIAGRGWIAIALVIFVKWNPYKAVGGALLFGGLSIVGFRLQAYNISQSLLDMLPYIVTIVVLVLSSIKGNNDSAPKALSIPYFREER